MCRERGEKGAESVLSTTFDYGFWSSGIFFIFFRLLFGFGIGIFFDFEIGKGKRRGYDRIE